ncbi:MAG: OsmC family protein [Chloroflexi bacterium]|nr:OsmC family protein [Chloroflexota bacterium]
MSPPDIESSGLPLVFKVPAEIIRTPTVSNSEAGLRVYVRALEGMQKEAVVGMATPSGQRTWRMVCDEGPYLNGTDLAPFPLAFFTAGTQFALMSEILKHARNKNVIIHALELIQDNYYTMDGSALQGTMIGGAKSPEITIKIESHAPVDDIKAIIEQAEQTSPAHAIFEDVLENTFALTFNDERLPVVDVRPWEDPVDNTLSDVFDAVKPDENADFRDDIITRVSAAEIIKGVEGGAGSSLQAEQKRTLHVHGSAQWTSSMQMETTIQLLKPLGSVFRFVCDEVSDVGGNETAPPPLAYLSAGVGFCFMTQVGRYAQITRQSLHSYQIIQDNVFVHEDSVTYALPVHTHLYLEADEMDEVAQRTLSMSERTCFLHAAMRGSTPVLVKIELNGQPL